MKYYKSTITETILRKMTYTSQIFEELQSPVQNKQNLGLLYTI